VVGNLGPAGVVTGVDSRDDARVITTIVALVQRF